MLGIVITVHRIRIRIVSHRPRGALCIIVQTCAAGYPIDLHRIGAVCVAIGGGRLAGVRLVCAVLGYRYGV